MTTAIRTQRPTPTVRFHLAAMRRAEDAARSISVRRSVGAVPAGELDDARALQESYFLLAAAHRSAARRLERPQRIRLRVELALRPIVRIGLRVRRAVTA